jgi:PPP family 3-phenylpropionic acid transporter
MIGSFSSGYFWDSLGSSLVFAMASVCCFIALIFAYIWVGRGNQTVQH